MISIAGLSVQRAGRFIGQDQRRLVDQRTRDGHALYCWPPDSSAGVCDAPLASGPHALQRRQRARACSGG